MPDAGVLLPKQQGEENIIQRGGPNPIEAQVKSIADTLDLLRKENVDIGEAAFATDKFLIYVDILHKRGDELKIIKVKSKCISANESPYKFDEKREYFFQIP